MRWVIDVGREDCGVVCRGRGRGNVFFTLGCVGNSYVLGMEVVI